MVDTPSISHFSSTQIEYPVSRLSIFLMSPVPKQDQSEDAEMISKLAIFLDFIADLFRSRALITGMVKNDFKVKYASSALGIVWAFIQPTVQDRKSVV